MGFKSSMQLAEWLVIQKEVLEFMNIDGRSEASDQSPAQRCLLIKKVREVRMPTLQVERKSNPTTESDSDYLPWLWTDCFSKSEPEGRIEFHTILPLVCCGSLGNLKYGRNSTRVAGESPWICQQYRAEKAVTCVSRYLKSFFESLKEKTRNWMLEGARYHWLWPLSS